MRGSITRNRAGAVLWIRNNIALPSDKVSCRILLPNYTEHGVMLYCFDPISVTSKLRMARGQQKIQSQQKAQEKAKKLAKAGGPDQKKAAQAALTWQCAVCKVLLIGCILRNYLSRLNVHSVVIES